MTGDYPIDCDDLIPGCSNEPGPVSGDWPSPEDDSQEEEKEEKLPEIWGDTPKVEPEEQKEEDVPPNPW